MQTVNLYTVALFAHVVGVIGVFVSLGTLLFGYVGLWRAGRTEQVRELAWLMLWSGNLALGALALLGAGGIYMALTQWGWRTGWIDVATAAFLLVGIGGTVAIDPRLRALVARTRTLPDGPLDAPVAAAARDPLVGSVLLIYVIVLLGIVWLMTTKPSVGGAIVAIVIAALVGVGASLPLWYRARRNATRTTAAAER